MTQVRISQPFTFTIPAINSPTPSRARIQVAEMDFTRVDRFFSHKPNYIFARWRTNTATIR